MRINSKINVEFKPGTIYIALKTFITRYDVKSLFKSHFPIFNLLLTF